MIMASQDQDHSLRARSRRRVQGREGTGGWRGSSRSRRVMMRRTRGGRSAPRPSHAHAGQAGTSYYLSPADKGGEPPGRWQGGGVADLGFREGQVIERAVFERLYGKFLDPA